MDGPGPTHPAVRIEGRGPPRVGGRRCIDIDIDTDVYVERRRKIEKEQIADGGIDGIVLGDIPVQLARGGVGILLLLRSRRAARVDGALRALPRVHSRGCDVYAAATATKNAAARRAALHGAFC